MKGDKGSLVLKTLPVVWQLNADVKGKRCDYCFKRWGHMWYFLKNDLV